MRVGTAQDVKAGWSDWSSHSPMPAKGRKMSHPRSLASEPGLQGSSDSQSYALPWSPSVQKDVLFLCHKD